MREIKFRSWDGEKMLSPKRTEVEISMRGLTETETFVLMQWTGKVDKHGVEVYESDVVETVFLRGQRCTGIVEWDEDEAAFQIKWITGNPYYARDSLGDLKVKVIGNIYLNKELLKANHE